MKSNLKLILCLTSVTTLIIVSGYFIGGTMGVIVAIAIAALMNVFSYYFSDKLFLAFSGGAEINREDMPWIHDMVEDLSAKAGLPKPRIFLLPEIQPNACATGRNKDHSIVAVTAGLLKILDKDEVEAVLAHEISHIRHNDILISAIASVLASAITILAHILYGIISSQRRDNNEAADTLIMDVAFIIFSPILAALIQTAISRSREYEADKGAVLLTRSKDHMINALKKIHDLNGLLPLHSATPSNSHMYIANPLHSKFLSKILSTHPSLENRIKNIESITL